VTSAVLLVLLAWLGDLRWRAGAILVVAFVAFLYCQFFGQSALVAAIGLGLQTMLAIYLIVRWRLSA
jgi:hypothetical protein